MTEGRPAPVVNLRLARKRRDRSDRSEAAAARRAEHGVPKADRASARALAERAARALDGHALEGRKPGTETDHGASPERGSKPEST